MITDPIKEKYKYKKGARKTASFIDSQADTVRSNKWPANLQVNEQEKRIRVLATEIKAAFRIFCFASLAQLM